MYKRQIQHPSKAFPAGLAAPRYSDVPTATSITYPFLWLFCLSQRRICSHLDVLLVSRNHPNGSPQGYPFPLSPTSSLAVALSSLLHFRKLPSIIRIEAHSPAWAIIHNITVTISPRRILPTFVLSRRKIGSDLASIAVLVSIVVPFTR